MCVLAYSGADKCRQINSESGMLPGMRGWKWIVGAALAAAFLLALFFSARSHHFRDQALLEAAKEGRTERVMDLLDQGARLEATEKHGWTPLMVAAADGRLETAVAFMVRGAKFEIKDIRGYTPLMAAAEDGHSETALALLAKGAKLGEKNNQG